MVRNCAGVAAVACVGRRLRVHKHGSDQSVVLLWKRCFRVWPSSSACVALDEPLAKAGAFFLGCGRRGCICIIVHFQGLPFVVRAAVGSGAGCQVHVGSRRELSAAGLSFSSAGLSFSSAGLSLLSAGLSFSSASGVVSSCFTLLPHLAVSLASPIAQNARERVVDCFSLAKASCGVFCFLGSTLTRAGFPWAAAANCWNICIMSSIACAAPPEEDDDGWAATLTWLELFLTGIHWHDRPAGCRCKLTRPEKASMKGRASQCSWLAVSGTASCQAGAGSAVWDLASRARKPECCGGLFARPIWPGGANSTYALWWCYACVPKRHQRLLEFQYGAQSVTVWLARFAGFAIDPFEMASCSDILSSPQTNASFAPANVRCSEHYSAAPREHWLCDL